MDVYEYRDRIVSLRIKRGIERGTLAWLLGATIPAGLDKFSGNAAASRGKIRAAQGLPSENLLRAMGMQLKSSEGQDFVAQGPDVHSATLAILGLARMKVDAGLDPTRGSVLETVANTAASSLDEQGWRYLALTDSPTHWLDSGICATYANQRWPDVLPQVENPKNAT